jgi:hypothetical protein
MNMAHSEKNLLLLGCGILRKEILHLAARNGWSLDTHFMDSALHCDLKRLSDHLQASLAEHSDRETIVFYGTCHPLMDAMLADAHTFRTEGQNCVEMLLGKELFDRELENGAFFLLEEWARRWEIITFKTFGTKNLQVIRDIYQGDRKYMLCLRTPCTSDFTDLAEKAADMVGLPVRWMHVSLDHLESILENAIAQRRNMPL